MSARQQRQDISNALRAAARGAKFQSRRRGNYGNLSMSMIRNPIQKVTPFARAQYPINDYGRGMVRQGELKGMDTGIGSVGNLLTTTNTNVDMYPLNLIRQGTGSWNRVGRKVQMKSLRFNFEISLTCPLATMNSSLVRVVVFYDKSPNGAAIPTWDTVFGTTGQDGVEAANNVLLPLRFDNMERFIVLRDKKFDIGITAGGTNSTNKYCVSDYVKLSNMETVFGGESAPMTIADIQRGALYIGYRATSNTGITTLIVQSASARLRYTDHSA